MLAEAAELALKDSKEGVRITEERYGESPLLASPLWRLGEAGRWGRFSDRDKKFTQHFLRILKDSSKRLKILLRG